MKIQFFSDLHVDVAPIKPIVVAADVDVVAVAGDVCQGVRNGFIALRKIVPERIPIVMTAGNHEFYRRAWPEEIADGKASAASFNIHFLEDDVVIIRNALAPSRDIRFIGCSLWTNYRVFGDSNTAAAMDAAMRGLNDHRVITWQKQPWLRFRPAEALFLHERSRKFIEGELKKPVGASTTTVLLTHHAPHFGSVEKRFENDILTTAYASDLSDLFKMTATDAAETSSCAIAIANHGHIHASCDYSVNGVRILANAHGYGPENPNFNSQLVVEVGK
jgi:predicted phosphodiesterase